MQQNDNTDENYQCAAQLKEVEQLNNIYDKYAQDAQSRLAEENFTKSLGDVVRKLASATTDAQFNKLQEIKRKLVGEYYAKKYTSKERAEIDAHMEDIQDALSDADVPVTVTCYADVVGLLEGKRIPQKDIDNVLDKLGDVEISRRFTGTSLAVKGFKVRGEVFVFADPFVGMDGTTDIENACVTYFHERQHVLNRLDGSLVRAILGKYRADASALYGVLEKLIGPNAASIYSNCSAVVLADEVSAFTMERVNTDPEWEKGVESARLDKEYIELIKNYINGKDNNSIVEGRQERPSHDNGSERTDGSSDGADSQGTSGAESNTGVQPRDSGNGERKGKDSEHTVSEENREVANTSYHDPRTMPDEEKQMRGSLLLNATQITVKENSIVATEELSAHKAAEKWWAENNPEPLYYETEVGEVEINKNFIKDSLVHRYSQAKLDAITGLADGFENAVYLGTMPDSRERGVVDHYFAFPIIYKGEVNYVFCRALQDANVNRLYVHEVFVADKIKKGDTLQTAASKPHGGISLYKDILANVLNSSQNTSSEGGVSSISHTENSVSAISLESRGDDSLSTTDKGSETSEETKTLEEKIAEEESKVNTNPSEAQKEAGNYRKGHIQVGPFDITIENPKGSIRSGVDAHGNRWETEMNNTYGYIRGTEGVDGDHIDVFLSDNPSEGKVYVVDQVNPETGEFDEHKVMYGFNSAEEARKAYLANYSEGWKGLGNITEVSKEDFEKWVNSSHRKTKPFVEYKGVKAEKKGQISKYEKKSWSSDSDISEMKAREEYLTKSIVIGSTESKEVFPEEEAFRRDMKDMINRVSSSSTEEKNAEMHAFSDKYKSYNDRVREVHKEISELNKAIGLAEQKQKEQIKAEKKAQSVKDKQTKYNGFLKSMTALASSKADKTLGIQAVFGEEEMTYAEFVEKHWKDGDLSFKTMPLQQYPIRWNSMDNEEQANWMRNHKPITTYIVNGIYVSKTAYDYAQFLSGKERKSVSQMSYAEVTNTLNKERDDIAKGLDVEYEQERKTLKREFDALMQKEKTTAKEETRKKELAELLNGGLRSHYDKKADALLKERAGELLARKDELLKEATEENKTEEIGPFGKVFRQFRGDAEGAIAMLRKEQGGEAVGALRHKDVGDIDLVWGEEGTGHSDGFGLAKLLKYHPEVVNNLQGIIGEMSVVSRNDNRINLESEKYKVAVRLTWDNEKKSWLLTAYEKKNSAFDNTTDTDETLSGKGNDTATSQNTVSSKDKDTQSSERYKQELLDFVKSTDSTNRVSINEKKYDKDELIMPLELDGKPSLLSARTLVPDDINQPIIQVATYDYSEAVEKNRETWQIMDDALEKYNASVDESLRGYDLGDTAIIQFRSVDAAVQFSDWIKRQGQKEGGELLILPFEMEDSGRQSDLSSKDKGSNQSAEKQTNTSSEKIDDVGEKIGGARKDLAAMRVELYKKMSQEERDKEMDTPDKVLSVAQIKNYVAKGKMSEEDGAQLISLNQVCKTCFDIMGDRYVEAVKNWIEGKLLGIEAIDAYFNEKVEGESTQYDLDLMEQKRKGDELYEKMLDASAETRKELSAAYGDLTMARRRETALIDSKRKWKYYKDIIKTYKDLHYPAVQRNLGGAFISKSDRYGYYVQSSLKAKSYRVFDSYEQALEYLEKKHPAIEAKTKEDSTVGKGKAEDHLYVGKSRAGRYIIKSRSIPGSIALNNVSFYSKTSAEKYLAENRESLAAKEAILVSNLMGTNIGSVQRVGKDWRQGKDISADEFRETFGFRGVEFGNYVTQVERADYLNKTYDAIMDFCESLGISPKAFSLNGELGLAFGARGTGSAAAHYEPMKVVINLTKTQGVGSLAHEWWHALDNYLVRSATGEQLAYVTQGGNVQRIELRDAFRAFVKEMESLPYRRRSVVAGDYWSRTIEMTARVFQVYMHRRLAEQGVVSPILTRDDMLYEEGGDDIPMPSDEEMSILKPYLDHIFDVLQERVDGNTGNVVLFQIGEDSAAELTGERRLAYESARMMLSNAGIPVEELSEDAIDQLAKMYVPKQAYMHAVMNNVDSALSALKSISEGTDEVKNAMYRDDLVPYGGTDEITFVWGKPGNAQKSYKGGSGISHILSKHGKSTLIKLLDVIAEGNVKRYVEGNKTVVLEKDGYEAVLALTRFGDKESWLLSGWNTNKEEEKEQTGENGEVSATSIPTQESPTFSRADLGAVVSDAKVRKEIENSITTNMGDAQFHKGKSERADWLDKYVFSINYLFGEDKKAIRKEMVDKINQARREAKELYENVLSGNFNNVTLRQINDYIDNATNASRFYRPVSQRLPERALLSLRKGERTGSVDALFSRICESAVPAHERTRASGRRAIEARKEELLEAWAKATGNWHEGIGDFTSRATPIDKGTDSEVFLSDDGSSVIKASKGKFDNRKFPSDIDYVNLFNAIFPGSAYRILGYGRMNGEFVRFLEQPFVDFSTATPLTAEE